PCPLTTDPSLECRAVEIADLTLEFTPAPEDRAVFTFEHGVRLDRWYIPESAQAGETLPIWLSWSFQEARAEHDIRFVHLINAAGELVGQQDITLGVREAGTRWAEQVDIALPANLPPGDYQVYAGWYLYPDIVNF